MKPETRAEAARFLESNGVRLAERPVALHPWTSNPAKSWPLEQFREIARGLRSKGKEVLLLGEPEESETTFGTVPGMVDLCRRIPLRLLPEVLRFCGLLISNDSGPVHVAAAVGTPTLVVAPREHAEQLQRWRPCGDSHRILIAPQAAEVLIAAREGLRISTLR